MPEAREELRALRPPERAAMVSALRKLEAGGAALGAPHTSNVKGSMLRELRPRRGHSPWRALYRQVGGTLVVAALAPEAHVDQAGFDRALRQAEARLATLEGEEDNT